MRDPAASAQGNHVASVTSDEDKELVLRCVREAIDDLGWKHDAVAAAISAALGRTIDGAYFSKMLSGDKPFSDKVLRALPNDIEQLAVSKYAEAMGLIVVQPLRGPAAMRALLSGLVGVLSSQPLRMAQARLRPARVRVPKEPR